MVYSNVISNIIIHSPIQQIFIGHTARASTKASGIIVKAGNLAVNDSHEFFKVYITMGKQTINKIESI